MGQIVENTKRRGMRPKTYLWIFSALASTSGLLYWEQIALLFVISTLTMCILLIVVALSDLEGRHRELSEADETAAAVMPRSNVTNEAPSSMLANS